MSLVLPAVMLGLLCGCGHQAEVFDRDTHARNKVYSILPQLQEEMNEDSMEHVFAPELLNPWVESLGSSRVTESLQVALEEMPEYRRSALWMLKAYSTEETWQQACADYPDLVAGLPGVEGYGNHAEAPNQSLE